MAQPTSRNEFKDYCLRKIGFPVIEVNVEDMQVEDRIDESLSYYWDYHFVDGEFCHHIGQATAGIAEYLVFGRNRITRVPLQVDLSQSTRAKTYADSYNISVNENENEFKKKARRILKAVV